MKFVNWLKFYFLGFFSDKYSGEAPVRNLWNSLLSVVLTIMILCTGYFTGYAVSFPAHYDGASEWKSFINSSLAGLELGVKDGVLSASETVNDFSALEGDEKLSGYGLIVDTRPAATAFAEFTVPCVDSKGNEITYEEYRTLSEDNKSNYDLKLQNTGKGLDVTVKQDEYKAFLNTTESGKNTLSELDGKLASGELSEKDYADEVYVAYVKAYYPSMSAVEAYGEAPTLRSYYLGMVTSSGFGNKYLMLLDDLLVGSFETDGGIQVDFEGYYSGVPDGGITDADAFIKQAFAGSGGYNYLLYFLNMFRLTAVSLVVLLVLALLTFVVIRYGLHDLKTGYIGSFKLVCSYLLISAVLSFVIAVALSFSNARSSVYVITAVVFHVIVAVRLAVFLTRGYILARRKAKEQEDKSAQI